jgi:predicted transcriptional regulator
MKPERKVGMTKSLTIQLDEESYRIIDEAAKAENRPLDKYIETCVLASIREQRAAPTTRPSEQLQCAVEEAEEGVAAGQWVEHEAVAAKLKEWAAREA